MPALLRENWFYKLLALIFAALLHFYVVNQQNPARLLTVPLVERNLPSYLLLEEDAPHQVMLTLNGPTDELDHMAMTDVSAYVDLSHARAGKNVAQPILIKAPEDLRVEASPDTVTLTLLPRRSRRLAVAVADPGPALAGYRFLPSQVTPRYVMVSGSQEAVDAVARLTVKTDSPTSLGTVDEDDDIIALDAQGSLVSDVTLSPSRAHVTCRMVRAPALKNVLVSADVIGSVSSAGRVDSIVIHPLTVVISGRPERLKQINVINTAPIDIRAAMGDLTRTVNCVAPPGVTFSGASAVAVTIHIVPQNAPVPVPNAPSDPTTLPPINTPSAASGPAH